MHNTPADRTKFTFSQPFIETAFAESVVTISYTCLYKKNLKEKYSLILIILVNK